MTPCPECAKRRYLCFEHHQQLVEDEETLRIFAERWDARLARERDAKIELGTQAFWLGRQVAKGELLLAEAKRRLELMALRKDPDWPSPTPAVALLPPDVAAEAIETGFTRGVESLKRRAG